MLVKRVLVLSNPNHVGYSSIQWWKYPNLQYLSTLTPCILIFFGLLSGSLVGVPWHTCSGKVLLSTGHGCTLLRHRRTATQGMLALPASIRVRSALWNHCVSPSQRTCSSTIDKQQGRARWCTDFRFQIELVAVFVWVSGCSGCQLATTELPLLGCLDHFIYLYFCVFGKNFQYLKY